MLSLPQLLINQDVPPTQLGATTSSSQTGKVPSRPFRLHFHLQPANKNQDKNQRQLLSIKNIQTTQRSNKADTNAPVEDNWMGAWATAIGPEQASNPPPRPRFNTHISPAPQETPIVNPQAIQRARPKFKKIVLDETPIVNP
ncbi:MAG: hypothetical protein ACKPKO_61240, partial [Candidatus Fonsibacter sp.]